LNELAGVQKTVAERQLKSLDRLNKKAEDQIKAIQESADDEIKQLDKQLKTAQDQVSILKGIDISVLSVATAMTGLSKAITATQAASASAARAASEASAKAYAQAMFNDTLTSGSASWSTPPDASGTGYGGSVSLMRSVMPSYDIGSNYIPYDQIAQLHEGEAVVPKAYNPAAGNGRQNSERLERLVEGLTKEVQRLQTIVNDGNKNTKRVADDISNVTEGGNAMRSRTV